MITPIAPAFGHIILSQTGTHHDPDKRFFLSCVGSANSLHPCLSPIGFVIIPSVQMVLMNILQKHLQNNQNNDWLCLFLYNIVD